MGARWALHQGGYLPFSVELTSHVPAGGHVFAVEVDSEWHNVPPEGDPKGAWSIDFLEPGGIYRDVTLRVVPDVFISDVFAMPQGVLSPSPTLRVEVTIDAASAPPKPVDVQVELVDGAATVASGSTSVAITKAGTHVVDLTLTGLGKPVLWSPSSPKLYTVRTTLTDHERSGAALARRQDRIPPGGVRARWLSSERQTLQALRSEPPSAVPIPRHGGQ